MTCELFWTAFTRAGRGSDRQLQSYQLSHQPNTPAWKRATLRRGRATLRVASLLEDAARRDAAIVRRVELSVKGSQGGKGKSPECVHGTADSGRPMGDGLLNDVLSSIAPDTTSRVLHQPTCQTPRRSPHHPNRANTTCVPTPADSPSRSPQPSPPSPASPTSSSSPSPASSPGLRLSPMRRTRNGRLVRLCVRFL